MNPLSQPLIATLRIAKVRAEEVHDLREALRVSVEMLADKDAEIDRLRAQNIHLRAQVRALMSGTTIQEQLVLLGRVDAEPDDEAIETDLRAVESGEAA